MSHDQAEGIRRLLASCDEPAGAAAAPARTGAKVIAVTSGKGGVGKSTLAANLAISVAHSGKRVVLVDMDLGLANVDLILGMEPRHNLHHVHPIADRIVAMARGEKIADIMKRDITIDQMTAMIV